MLYNFSVKETRHNKKSLGERKKGLEVPVGGGNSIQCRGGPTDGAPRHQEAQSQSRAAALTATGKHRAAAKISTCLPLTTGC